MNILKTIYILSLLLLINFNSFSFGDSLNTYDSLQFIGNIGKFQNAVSISTAREEFIFVSDIQSNKIYKLTTGGLEVASFGGSGLGQNELNQPYSIDASNGLDVIIADYQNNRIKRLDINLNYILSFDFNSYNLSAESDKKIYNPRSVLTISSGEVFVICDATNYEAAKINDYSEISVVFGSNSIGYDKLDDPVKIVKGNQLDLWILDKKTNDLVNFNNFGVFVKKISNRENNPIISIAYFNENLFILHPNGLIIYDLKKG
ncbi:MAG: hypothetical protein ABI543_15640, partial [Ignavibacteria bacterium]